jgi:hypothetical protein
MRFTRSLRVLPALLALTLGLAACASGGGAGGDTTARRGSSTRIVEDELVNVSQLTAYAAVQRLRPTWLRTRTGGTPQVHVDGTPQAGGIEVLGNLPAAEIQEMVFMNAADATTRFGTNYVSGVILVTTKRGR